MFRFQGENGGSERTMTVKVGKRGSDAEMMKGREGKRAMRMHRLWFIDALVPKFPR